MRVIIADDAAVVREGLARLLVENEVDVVATAGDGQQLLRLVDAQLPDVAILDIRMPPSYTNEGMLAAEQIRQDHPTVGTMLLSQYVEVSLALRLLTDPAERIGYLLKDRIADITEFVSALHRVASGGVVVEPTLVDELLTARANPDPLAVLTPREYEVLALVAGGKTDRGIAAELVVTRKTVESHVRRILAKLDLPEDTAENRRVHAVLTFLRHSRTGAASSPRP